MMAAAERIEDGEKSFRYKDWCRLCVGYVPFHTYVLAGDKEKRVHGCCDVHGQVTT